MSPTGDVHRSGKPAYASECRQDAFEQFVSTHPGYENPLLDYFNAPADEYALVFTANASGALKLVGEPYPFHPAAGTCSPSTTTTRSTASASSPRRAAPTCATRP